MAFFGQGGTEQASFWKNFQDFFSKAKMGDAHVPPQSVTPAQRQPQSEGFMNNSSQQMPNFLSQLQQLSPTPMPQEQQLDALKGGQGNRLPPGSYASQIRGFTQSYK